MVYDGTKVLIINYPRIKTIKVSTIHYLKVNGVLFQEISFAVVGLQMKCIRNVIGLALDSSFGGEHHNLFAQRFLEIVGSFKALKNQQNQIWTLLERKKETVGMFFL
jgi:hypothetical protein